MKKLKRRILLCRADPQSDVAWKSYSDRTRGLERLVA